MVTEARAVLSESSDSSFYKKESYWQPLEMYDPAMLHRTLVANVRAYSGRSLTF
jgi:hypothetical protein